MKVLVVVKRGIYRHELVGVFSDMGLANFAALEAMGKEPDSHHDFEIVEFELDDTSGTEKVTGSWSQRSAGDTALSYAYLSDKKKGPPLWSPVVRAKP